jgi:predicted cobalt transporter CbtA
MKEVVNFLALCVGLLAFIVLAFLIEGCTTTPAVAQEEPAVQEEQAPDQQLTEQDFILACEVAMNQAEQEGWQVVGIDSRNRLMWVRKAQESEQRPWMVRYWRLQPTIDAIVKARAKAEEKGGE